MRATHSNTWGAVSRMISAGTGILAEVPEHRTHQAYVGDGGSTAQDTKGRCLKNGLSSSSNDLE